MPRPSGCGQAQPFGDCFRSEDSVAMTDQYLRLVFERTLDDFGLTPAVRVAGKSRSGVRSLPVVAAIPEKTQQEQEEVDEVQVERKGADNRGSRSRAGARGERQRLQPLRVIQRQAGEDDHSYKRDQELQRIVVPEDPDD